mmetsp:Transcript_66712/g.169063  ORF Transcript_66712/g.169063 Transcript_66712/m.169063 type:complete len:420 (+) Transcript_66712:74-1333(+)
MSANNPLQWPSFEQLGRDFYEKLRLALSELQAGKTELSEKAKESLDMLQVWLDAPCVASVKLDGTNVGIDDSGLVVGRNKVCEPGQSYQKVDVWTVLQGYGDKAASMKAKFEAVSGGEEIAQLMLYGELLVNSKYDYDKAGLFKVWRCFGAVMRPAGSDGEAPTRLSAQLRGAGFNACPTDARVLIALNESLGLMLAEHGIPTVYDGYTPDGAGSSEDWAQHDGSGNLPWFTSLRSLVVSDWTRRLLVPKNGQHFAEGLVVASEVGRLFKLKNGGEALGMVPAQLEESVKGLRALQGHPALPDGLLPVFEVLLLVATTKPPAEPKNTIKEKPKTNGEDHESMAVFESTLTKYDALEEVFERGPKAKTVRAKEMSEQVARDLVKDYGADAKDAQHRAFKVVSRVIGARYGAWLNSQKTEQ